MKKIFPYLSVLVLLSCHDKLDTAEAYRVGGTDCRVIPSFVAKTPINPLNAGFATAQNNELGITLIEPGTTKKWKHPSWDKYGYFGQIATSNLGTIFLAPIPMVNALKEPEQGFNTVYAINSATGELEPFVTLSQKQTDNNGNPFGILGLNFDCSSNVLYVTTVYGSTKEQELGAIYAINVETKEVIDKYPNTDAFGCIALGTTGEKRLYFGSSRTSEVFSIELDRKGAFIGKAKPEFSLEMLGPRGDDKAKKFRFKNNILTVIGYEFLYNLTAATEVQETYYNFVYDRVHKKWDYQK